MPTHAKLQLASRRGWTVVGTTFITLGMVLGVWYSYSVFLVAFAQFLIDRVGWRWAFRVLAGLIVGWM